jgi:hypothetical protein
MNVRSYDVPLAGTYWMKTPDLRTRQYRMEAVGVLVTGETDKQYEVRARVSIRGHKPGEPIMVRRRNVKLERVMEEPVKVEADYSEAWWNK